MVTEVRTGVQPGERSPAWTLPRLDGSDLSLASLRGTKALLFFWGSW